MTRYIGPSPRQLAMLRAIVRLSRVGYPPTLRELGAELGIESTNGVVEHLTRLEAKGYIVRHPVARGIVMTGTGRAAARGA